MHTNVQKITPTIDVGIKKTEIEVVTASPGENVMFTCQIPKEASDQLVFQWLHDGKMIQQGPKKVRKYDLFLHYIELVILSIWGNSFLLAIIFQMSG